MKGARQWASVGLLCLCGVFGCATAVSWLIRSADQAFDDRQVWRGGSSDRAANHDADALARDDRNQIRPADPHRNLNVDSAATAVRDPDLPSGLMQRQSRERPESESVPIFGSSSFGPPPVDPADRHFEEASRNADHGVLPRRSSTAEPPDIRSTRSPRHAAEHS